MKILPREKRLLAVLLLAALCGGVLILIGKRQMVRGAQSEEDSVSYSDETEHKIKQIVGALTGEEPQVFLSYATKTTKSEAQSVFGSEPRGTHGERGGRSLPGRGTSERAEKSA